MSLTLYYPMLRYGDYYRNMRQSLRLLAWSSCSKP